MAKKVENERCPHCGSEGGYYTKVLYRTTHFHDFDGSFEATQSSYTKVSGGELKRCIECHKQIEIEN